ncbi:MAG: WD40/YVTN/BNR-like repeat-containing protein, partial [Candidatus Binatia bacterium]
YAGGHDLAVIKSEDGGTTWQRAGKGLPTRDIHALAIDPTRPNRLHAWAVGKGLYRSDDGAKTWSRVDDGPENPNVTSLTSVPIATGMGGIFLYAGTAVGLFRNADCF